ncbi:MAG: hypothetical protein ACI4I6_06945 [Hominimerdicola sp.]
MGFFTRKKSESKPVVNNMNDANKTVNPDDIWNTPVRKSGTETVTLKESKYDSAKTEILGTVPEVRPEDVKEKMAQLERELAEKSTIPAKTYHDYDVNPVHAEETEVAQEKFEKEYAVSHENFLRTHVEDISPANEENLDEKVSDMLKVHEEKIEEEANKDFGFNSVADEEVSDKLKNLSYAKKAEDYPEYKDIKEIAVDEESVERLGRIDHSDDEDEIKSISADVLDGELKKFNEKYGD